MSEKHFGLDVNNPTSYNDIVKKILITVLPILVIAGLIIAAYEYLMSTPLAKAMNSLLGGASALLTAIGDQLKTCSDNGFFSKGCYMGWLSIGVGLIWGVAKIWDKFSPPKGVALENLAALIGKSTSEARDIITNSEEFKTLKKTLKEAVENKENNFSESMQETILEKGFQRIATKKSIEEINRSRISEEQKAAQIETIKENYKNASSEIDKNADLSEEDSKASDDFIENTIPIE